MSEYVIKKSIKVPKYLIAILFSLFLYSLKRYTNETNAQGFFPSMSSPTSGEFLLPKTSSSSAYFSVLISFLLVATGIIVYKTKFIREKTTEYINPVLQRFFSFISFGHKKRLFENTLQDTTQEN